MLVRACQLSALPGHCVPYAPPSVALVLPPPAGHEIVGVITEVGPEVKGFKVGDRAAVGCMVGSCGDCPDCKAGLQQYCNKGVTWTYDSGGWVNEGVGGGR